MRVNYLGSWKGHHLDFQRVNQMGGLMAQRKESLRVTNPECEQMANKVPDSEEHMLDEDT